MYDRTQAAEHPGVTVRRLLDETGLSVTDAAQRLNVSRSQLSRLLGKQSGMSPEMALRLAAVFGIDAREYLDRQTTYQLARARREVSRKINKLKPYRGALRRRNKAHVIETLRQHKHELQDLGLEHLYLFGSVARGEATPKSDIDLCYESSPGNAIGLIKLGKIEQRLSEILGAPADLVPGDNFEPRVRVTVEKEKISIY